MSAAEASQIDVCNAGQPQALAYVYSPTDNFGDIKASGLDFSFQLNPAPTPYGRFNLGINATYIFNYKQQLSKGGSTTTRWASTRWNWTFPCSGSRP